MSLILLLSEGLVGTHRYVLFLFYCTRCLIPIVAAHGSTSLSCNLLCLLLHSLTKRSSNGASIAIVNHWFTMRLTGHPKLILISAVRPILWEYGVLQILVLCNRSHEVIVLWYDPLVRWWLSLLLSQLRLALIGVLGLHILAYYLILWKLFLGYLLLLVAVESALVRIQAHAHVVKADLRLVKDLVVRWAREVYGFFLLDFATWGLMI